MFRDFEVGGQGLAGIVTVHADDFHLVFTLPGIINPDKDSPPICRKKDGLAAMKSKQLNSFHAYALMTQGSINMIPQSEDTDDTINTKDIGQQWRDLTCNIEGLEQPGDPGEKQEGSSLPTFKIILEREPVSLLLQSKDLLRGIMYPTMEVGSFLECLKIELPLHFEGPE